MLCHPLLDRPILRQKCVVPLGFSKTTKAYLLARKYTFSYSPLVLWWPPLFHFKGKRVFFLTFPWFQHSFKITYNFSNIVKRALRQGRSGRQNTSTGTVRLLRLEHSILFQKTRVFFQKT